MLSIIGTPIGNLSDLSLRAAKTLAESDIILAEDTRSAQILIDYVKKSYELQVTSYKLISYYREIEFEKLPQVLSWLKEDKNVSLISESGMPLISDPGYLLVKHCIKENLSFTVIPGPSAVTTALIYSGFNSQNFVFLGFLPKKSSQIISLFSTIKQFNNFNNELIYIFFESAKRINKTLELLSKELPASQVVICREMTKKFEEIIRGKPTDLLNRSYKGELTVVFKANSS